MLIQCPECQLQVSDKAISCPHCGYVLDKAFERRQRRKPNKRKRLPNGFGQISELKGMNLRKPFRALVTVGKTETGKFITKPLKPQSYFATYNDAYVALVEYNTNPYELNDSITMTELYDRWYQDRYESKSAATDERSMKSAWSYASSISKMQVSDVRTRHLKGCIDDAKISVDGMVKEASANTKCRMKSMFNLMFDYALEYELTDKNYARMFSISDKIVEEKEEAKRGHLPFTEKEMELLWANINSVPYIDVLLIQCYGGWRPQELGLIRLENVDLVNDMIVGGMKTKAGTDRKVPIHPRIKHLVEAKYQEAVTLGSEYLINCTNSQTHTRGYKMTYDKYKNRFAMIRDSLLLDPLHRPHDPRMHFITMAKKYNVDEYALKYIVGHEIKDITEKVYTKRDDTWLKKEMNKIP